MLAMLTSTSICEALALAVERWLAVDRENLNDVSAAAGWLECHARNLSGAVGDLSALAARKHWSKR